MSEDNNMSLVSFTVRTKLLEKVDNYVAQQNTRFKKLTRSSALRQAVYEFVKNHINQEVSDED